MFKRLSNIVSKTAQNGAHVCTKIIREENMQKRIFGLISIVVVFATILCTAAFAEDLCPNIKVNAHALWIDDYDSYSDMGQNADLIVFGSVESQNSEPRCDLVFTRSVIQITEEYTGNAITTNTIEVIQTGGCLGSVSTHEFEDAPILKNDGTEYLLFLEYVNDETYGEYYLILGGGIGAIDCSDIEFDSNYETVSCDELTNRLDQELDIESIGISAYATATNTTGGYFYTKTPKVFYRSTVTSSMLAYVKNGILAWNNGSSTTGATVSTTTSSSAANVTVSAGAYGSTGWAGYTWRYNSSGTEVTVDRYASAYIGLNTSFLSSSSSNWKLVAMHEMGHVFGLAHTNSISTVMRTSYSTLIGTGLTAPTSADYNGVKIAYSYGGL